MKLRKVFLVNISETVQALEFYFRKDDSNFIELR